MYEKEVSDLFSRFGLTVGACAYSDVALNGEPDRFKTVITTVLPYWFKPEGKRNISIYAMLPDYHKILGGILENITAELKELFPNNIFEYHVDVSPVNEKKAAALSGLGFIGKNTLLINERFGSFVFIGDICTDAEICIKKEFVSDGCGDCNLCVKACPGNALCKGFNIECCVSAITQKKGELTDSEASILRRSGSVWGCDVCSLVCPYNKGLEISSYYEDCKDRLIQYIDKKLLDGLSNGDFRRKFNDRAFVWRGISVLRRNIDILECNE